MNEIGRCLRACMVTLALTSYATHASTDNSNFILGVGSHVAQNKNTANDVMELFSYAGIRFIRDEAYWSSIEKSPGRLMFPNDLSDLDKLLYGIYSKGGRPLIVLDYGNALYDNGGPLPRQGVRHLIYMPSISQHGMPRLTPSLTYGMSGMQAHGWLYLIQKPMLCLMSCS